MAMSKQKRMYLWEMQNGICWFCKRVCTIDGTGGEVCLFTVEHIIPEVWGGTNVMDNLVGACHGCNNSRGAAIVGISLRSMKLAYLVKLYERRHINSLRTLKKGRSRRNDL